MDHNHESLYETILGIPGNVQGSDYADASVLDSIFNNWMIEIMIAREQAMKFWNKYHEQGNIDDLNTTIIFEREIVTLMPKDGSQKQNSLSSLAVSLLARFKHTGDLEDLEEAIALQQHAVELTPEDTFIDPRYLSLLGDFLGIRFNRLGQVIDVEIALSFLEQAVKHTHVNNSKKHGYLGSLGRLLYKQFEQSGEVADINRAIQTLQQAVDLTPNGHPEKPSYLNNLGSSFQMRFRLFGKVADIDQAIHVLQQAADLTPNNHAVKPSCLNNLGNSFQSRFRQFGQAEDIDRAIHVEQQAVDLTPSDNADKPIYLNNLGSSLQSRFGRYGEVADIQKAIHMQQQAIDLIPDGHPDKPNCLNNLGNSFESRFGRFSEVTDIDQAIYMLQQAVDLTPNSHANKSAYLNDLGNSLGSRFRRFGKVADIDRAIHVLQQAINLTPNDHPDKPSCLNNLGNSLRSRFRRFGEAADIDHAIHAQQQAVDLTSNAHANKVIYLNNLGNSFESRFGRFGEVADINQAIYVQQQAVDLTPHDHPQKSGCLSNLGMLLGRRFEQSNEAADIDRAIHLLQQAVDLTPTGHASKPSFLSDLGILFRSRFGQFGEVANIDQAIHVQQQAVDLIPDANTEKPSCLNNLGNSLESRFERFGEVADIDQAIHLLQQAVDLTPNGHAVKPGYLNNLGNLFTTRFNHAFDINHLNHAISAYSASALSLAGSPHIRLHSARKWALLALNPLLPPSDPHLSLLPAGRVIMELIPRVVWLGNSIILRYQDISSIGNSVNIAASIACSSGRPDLALEWLEQGRSIVWSQMINLRTPVDDLEHDHPELAARIKNVSRSLETIGSNLDILSSSSPTVLSKDRETGAQEHRRLAQEWEDLIATVRQCSGYENFLQPPTLSTLAPAAILGPVIAINVESHRCDAIILHNVNGFSSTKLEHVHLKSASLDKITKAHHIFTRALIGRGARCTTSGLVGGETPEDFSFADTEQEQLLLDFISCSDDNRASIPAILLRPGWMSRIFQMLWTDIVNPIFQALGYTSLPPNHTLPHVTWCTTGPLAFLPLHAAGYYTQDGSMSDFRTYRYAISSYTPSFSTLLKRKQGIESQDFRGLTVISQPSTPGQSPLPCTKDEANRLQVQFDVEHFTWLNDAAASQDTVLDQMRKRSWIHLACHGVQQEGSPMDSAFMLHDGPLSLRTISRETLPHARLAFLSACQTAKGDKNLPEEAAHLAAGMLMSGYHTVVGTMWSIRDQDGPIVAEEFYKYLRTHGMRTDDGEAAYALHEAVGRLREKVGEENFLAWIPFIHLGI